MKYPLLTRSVKRVFRLFGMRVEKYDSACPEPWSHVKEFQSLFDEIKERTVVSQDRCFMLYQLARYAGNKSGDIAEVGVYKGGTGKLIARTCPGKKVHLFDTFSGMPDVNPETDYHEVGDFRDTSLSSVQEFLADCNNAVFHPGFFPATANVVENAQFCFVYVDVDIYQSVKDCLHFFYGRMVPGGVMAFDDYEWKDCPGVKKAISEFLADKKEIPVISARYQCMLIKE